MITAVRVQLSVSFLSISHPSDRLQKTQKPLWLFRTRNFAARTHEMYSLYKVSCGAKTWPSADVFVTQQVTQHRQTLPNQMFRQQVSQIDRSSGSSQAGACFSFRCSQKNFVSMCLMAPLPLRRANAHALLKRLSRFAHELRD